MQGYPPGGGYGGPPPGPPAGPPGGYGPPPGGGGYGPPPGPGGFGQPPQPPPGFAPPGGFQGGPAGAPNPGKAQGQVSGPGIALIVVGVIALLWHLGWGILSLLGSGLNVVAGGSGAMGGIMSGIVGAILYIVMALLQGIVIFGGVKMKNLQSWGLSVAAAVVALLPCTNWICCLIGAPIGIWALVVLMNQEVKASFRS